MGVFRFRAVVPAAIMPAFRGNVGTIRAAESYSRVVRRRVDRDPSDLMDRHGIPGGGPGLRSPPAAPTAQQSLLPHG